MQNAWDVLKEFLPGPINAPGCGWYAKTSLITVMLEEFGDMFDDISIRAMLDLRHCRFVFFYGWCALDMTCDHFGISMSHVHWGWFKGMVRETYGFICYYHPKRSWIPFPSNPGKTCLLPFPGGKNFWKKIRETELFFSLRPVMWDIFLDMIPPSHGRDVGTN